MYKDQGKAFLFNDISAGWNTIGGIPFTGPSSKVPIHETERFLGQPRRGLPHACGRRDLKCNVAARKARKTICKNRFNFNVYSSTKPILISLVSAFAISISELFIATLQAFWSCGLGFSKQSPYQSCKVGLLGKDMNSPTRVLDSHSSKTWDSNRLFGG